MTTDIKELTTVLRLAAESEIAYRAECETSHLWQDEASPDNVLAVIAALEAKDAECKQLSDELRGKEAHVALLNIDLREIHAESDAKDARIAELETYIEIHERTAVAAIERAEMADRRSAELQSRAEAAEVLAKSHKALRDSMAAIHNTIRGDGAYVSLSVLLSASKRAYEESAQAAKVGIQIQGGE